MMTIGGGGGCVSYLVRVDDTAVLMTREVEPQPTENNKIVRSAEPQSTKEPTNAATAKATGEARLQKQHSRGQGDVP